MKLRIFLIFISVLFLVSGVQGQINAKLIRYMDVSDTKITFVYGGDIWVIPKTGGTAFQVTHSPGEESWPRFSPDGKLIAYTASYNGNRDIYVIPALGGVPARVTYQSSSDRMVDWHPDGNHILFASSRESGIRRLSQFYLVHKSGGFPEKLKIPYGELASYSPDGTHLAYITKITENYPFKRYRGGLASDIIIYNLQKDSAENITKNDATDGKPAWVGKNIYFLSDQAENMRHNIWKYSTKTKSTKQLTNFNDFDISYMSAGKKDIVFEAGGILYLMELSTEKYRSVEVKVVTDLFTEIPRAKDVRKQIRNMTMSPDAKRIVFEARGELFNVPAEKGFVVNMTRTSGAFDHNPSWSPDGKNLAYWSDISGEYQIYLKKSGNPEKTKLLTKRKKGYGYSLYWSPDSKKLAFIDETNEISIIDAETGETTIAGNTRWNVGHGGRYFFPISWSPDSKWISFTIGMDNANDAIFIYNLKNKKLNQVTSGFFNDMNPVFSKDGNYLFFLTNRSMTAIYSDMGDGTWVYPNATLIGVLSLTKSEKSLLYAENDSYEAKKKKPESAKNDKKKESKKPVDVTVKIDFSNIESRAVTLPPKAGNIGRLSSLKDKVVFIRWPNSGAAGKSASLMYYDLKKREEKQIISGVLSYLVSSDGKSILVKIKGRYGIVKPAASQKIKKSVPVSGLVMDLVPKQEWRQIFNDIWRRHRDFFYDPQMHNVDWQAMRKRYGNLIEYARTRWDVTNICSNLAAELSAGHTYTFGGDVERVIPKRTGFLGIEWEPHKNKYRIKRIIKPAVWDTVVRSPFDRSGVDVQAGDYILNVNGIGLDHKKDPYAAFDGFSGKTVALMISRTGKPEDSKRHVIKCLTQNEELNLRFREWIENNRKLVDKLSGGKLGYVYMRDTSSGGQMELVRMYYGQLHKKGFIIDERFNGGGQLADRFLELLQRPVIYNLHWRHGKDQTFPVKTNTGPLGMLINGWAGSGGDGLPWAFKELKAGPVVGKRTLGILVGPATGHRLIDGGGITVPGARLYYNNGQWFEEGEGVSPDFEVWDDPNILVKGRDPQMEKVVEEVMKLLKKNSPKMTPAPKPDDRTAKGLRKK